MKLRSLRRWAPRIALLTLLVCAHAQADTLCPSWYARLQQSLSSGLNQLQKIRLPFRRTDAGVRQALSTFVQTLPQEELKAMRGRLLPMLQAEARKLTDWFSLPSAFFELPDFNSPQQVIEELQGAFRILAKNQTPSAKASALNSWIRSDIHTIYLYDLLTRLNTQEAKEILSALKKESPAFSIVKSYGLLSPPYKELSEVLGPIPGFDDLTHNTLTERLRFVTLAEKFKLGMNGRGFRLQWDDGNTIQIVETKDFRMSHDLARRADEVGWEKALRSPLSSVKKRFLGGDPSKPISLGLEAELTDPVNPRIFDAYRLNTFKEEQWAKMNDEARLDAVERAMNGYWGRGTYPFSKRPGAPAFLPEKMDADHGRKIELNGLIFETVDEARAFTKDFQRLYGPAYWQGHVVYPKSANMDGHLGYIILESDRAQLETLENGYAKYLADPKVQPGRFLTHPFLGPLDEKSKEAYAQIERKAGSGEEIGKTFNTRLHNGPALRDDPYPRGFVGFELRQFHKRADQLLDAMDELSLQLHHVGDLRPLDLLDDTKMTHLGLLDRLKHFPGGYAQWRPWHDLLKDVGTQLQARYSDVQIGGAPFEERFLLPLREWDRHLAAMKTLSRLELAEFERRVKAATTEYIRIVSDLAARRKLSAISIDEAIEQLQVAASKWAYEAQISPVLKQFKDKELIRKNDTWMDLATKNGRIASFQSVPKTPIPIPNQLRLPTERRTFSNQKPYTQYVASRAQLDRAADSQLPVFKNFLRNTVELRIEQSDRGAGHVQLRIGETSYSFNLVRSAHYLPNAVARNRAQTGLVFYVPESRIAEKEREIRRIYDNSSKYNIPPFDIDSRQLEVEGTSPNLYLKRTDNTESRDRSGNQIFGRLVKVDGVEYFETPWGYRQPAHQNTRNEYCIQSLSCSSSAAYVLKKFFDIDIGPGFSANGLAKMSETGNPFGRSPDVVIKYWESY